MRLFRFLRPISSAPVARERLQILLAYERSLVRHTDLIAVLREDILAVVGRNIVIDHDRVQIKVERRGESSIFEAEIDIPDETLVTASFWAQPSQTQLQNGLNRTLDWLPDTGQVLSAASRLG